MFSVFMGIYLDVELLGHMTIASYTFEDLLTYFPTDATILHFPQQHSLVYPPLC